MERTIVKIMHDEVNFNSYLWFSVSDSLKNLIKKMLQKDLNLRISAEEALNSDWFYPLSKISLQLNPTNTEALTNLTKFHQVNYN